MTDNSDHRCSICSLCGRPTDTTWTKCRACLRAVWEEATARADVRAPRIAAAHKAQLARIKREKEADRDE